MRVVVRCRDGTVFEEVTPVGRSNESFEDAVEDAIGRAEQTLDNLMWASVTNRWWSSTELVELDRTEREYRAEVEVAFELEEAVAE